MSEPWLIAAIQRINEVQPAVVRQAPRSLELRLAALVSNSWLYSHERDEIVMALDDGTATEGMFVVMQGRVRDRLASWKRSQ